MGWERLDAWISQQKSRPYLEKDLKDKYDQIFVFNKTLITWLYTNLKTILNRHSLSGDRIYNFSESSVYSSTLNILALRSQKQVGQSAERGAVVSCYYTGQWEYHTYVVSRVHSKNISC